MGVGQMIRNESWRKSPVHTTIQVGRSIVRQRNPHSGDPVVDFDDGRSRITADLSTANGLQLYRYGIHDPELDLVRLLLDPGDHYLDAGANIGLFTLVAAARVGPGGCVYAFEPAPSCAHALERNAWLNGFSWIEVHREALADQTGTETLFVFQGSKSGFSSFAPSLVDESTAIQTRVTTVDHVVAKGDEGRLRLMKIDVEGAELRVIRGAHRLLSSVRPDMLIEIETSHLFRQGASVAELEGILRVHGYRAYAVTRTLQGGVAITPSEWARSHTSPNLFLTTSPLRVAGRGIVVVSND